MITRVAGKLIAGAAVVLLLAPGTASADTADEVALAARFAPVVRLVDQPEQCGPGKPYVPTNVNLLLRNPTVALRGPWGGDDRSRSLRLRPTSPPGATSITSTRMRSIRAVTTCAGPARERRPQADRVRHVVSDPAYRPAGAPVLDVLRR